MAIQLWIEENKKGKFWIHSINPPYIDSDGNEVRVHRGTVGNPGGYELESTALNVAYHYRKDMDDSIAPGQSVHIFSSRGVRIG